MLDSLKNLLGGGGRLQNPEGLSKRVLNLLRDEFAGLDGVEKGLARRVSEYVVDGRGDEVLLALCGGSEVVEALKLTSVPPASGIMRRATMPRRELLGANETVSGKVLFRLGEVYHAAQGAQSGTKGKAEHLSPDLRWLEALMIELSGISGYHWVYSPVEQERYCSVSDLVAALEAGGHAPDALARHCLYQAIPNKAPASRRGDLVGVGGLGVFLAEHVELVTRALEEGTAAERESRLELIEQLEVPRTPELLRCLSRMAVGSLKRLREQAMKSLKSNDEDVAVIAGEFRRLAADGKPAERKLAAAQVLQGEGEGAIGFLKERLAEEKAKSVATELERLLQTGAAVEEAAELPPLEIPPAREFVGLVEVTPAMAADLLATAEAFAAEAVEEHKRIYAASKQKFTSSERKEAVSIPAKRLKKMAPLLRDGSGLLDLKLPADRLRNWWAAKILDRHFRGFVERHHIGLVGQIRLLSVLGFIRSDPEHNHPLWQERLEDVAVEWLTAYMVGPGRDMNLRDLGAAFEVAGLPSSLLVSPYTLHRWDTTWNPLQLEPERIWPFFADRLEALEESLGIRPLAGISDWQIPENRRRAYRVLETFPTLPPSLLPYLWEQALSGGKTDRSLAWACLAGVPGRWERLVAALGDGKKLVRATAAEWLGQMGSEESVDPLVKALKKEKMDDVKAAIMEALEKSGAELDRFLNRSKQQEEAEKGLAKGIPKALEWFPFDGLPEVRWEKNRRKVPDAVLRWMIVQACKTKNPEPGPLLRRYAALMGPEGRKAFGMFILKSWLAEDTKPANTPEEAAAYADRDTTQMIPHAAAHPEWYPDFKPDVYRKQVYRHFLEECLGSANSSKGILAVAGACGDAAMVPLASAYVKKWYGRRLHQCKALLRMLSWVDEGTAIQYVLSISTRFRTKGIQKEAGLVADEIAARKGWTRDEMADRTIPNGGFGEDGTLEIDFGSRQFVARLMDDFSIELKRGDGKVIKSLPNATKAEDEAEVKELKKGYTSAKREIKEVVKLQKDRLYEAMCQGRAWRFEDWDLFLNRHTVVGRYCQRLVWVAKRDGEVLTCFRPLPDRTLTDADDETVELQPDDRVMLAHRADLDEAVAAAWIEHLRDYEVEPLFPQLDTKLRTLGDGAGKLDEIKEYEGHMISTFRLRGEAGKRGYTRGEAEDGGWFYTYHKRFEGLAMQATIEFTGNGIPEEERPVALLRMYFTRQSSEGEQQWNARHVPLKELPPVLLSECWNDLDAVAAKGEGFDKDWEKKSEY